MVAGGARWLVRGWLLLLTVLLLGPALLPGYVLTYDMVWVPDLALRPDFWGLGSALPRAVPSDLVVSLLDELVPGMLLQKLVLAGALLAGGLGAVRLAPPGSTVGQLVSGTVYTWNPFVIERLVIGHWPVLLGYAVLPWVAVAAGKSRRVGRVVPALWWLVPVGSLSASAGAMTTVALLVFGWRRRSRRFMLRLTGLAVAANAPWVAAGLLHLSAARTDAEGVAAFALNGVDRLPAPLAALGLGGIWNQEVVPPSRQGPLAVAALLFLLALAVLGLRGWRRQVAARDRTAYAVCWGTGFGIAIASWALPTVFAWFVVNVPGAGLFRDGARSLALCAPLLASLTSYGAVRVVQAFKLPAARTSAVLACVLLPIALLPDAAFGASGRLGAVHYPAAYDGARESVRTATAAGHRGDVLVLPFTAYRAPDWNGGRKVLDPLGRYLPVDFVAADDLVVSDVRIRGEDVRARRVAAALAAGPAADRAAALARLGIGFVATDRSALAPVPPTPGDVIALSPRIRVTALPGAVERQAPTAWRVTLAAAWCLFAVPLAAALVHALVHALVPGRRRVRRS